MVQSGLYYIYERAEDMTTIDVHIFFENINSLIKGGENSNLSNGVT